MESTLNRVTLDIVPALELANLERLAQVLLAIDAWLPQEEEIGCWKQEESTREMKWVSRIATPEELRQRAEWIPDPVNVSSFHALLHTRYGNLDVVPLIAGAYDTLRITAQIMPLDGQEVWTAHIDDLLATLTIPRKHQDIERVRRLREIQRAQKAMKE